MRQASKRQLRLRILHSLVGRNFRELKELSSLVEGFLKKEYKSILIRADKEITDDLPEETASFLAESYAEDLQRIEDVFPRIQRYSMFITAMSMIEGSIITLCKGTKQIFNLNKDFNPKKPNVINRGIEYLVKNLSIKTDRYKHYIEFVDSLRKVRNCIVHSEGRVAARSDESDIRSFVASIPTLGIDRYDRILVLEGFIDISIHEADLLLQRLFDSIRKRQTIAQQRD